ncbi:hypothetical protein IQ238_23405 [Pleurocapsales cyanobacterium LEGE 06147]|nr:hypothetical protein [Pleurocapsales cyanobacterium LEGE 06147]
MFNGKHFQATASALITLTISTAALAPLITLAPASAQLFPSQGRPNRSNTERVYSSVVIPAGTQIPVEYEKDKILVTKEETAPLTVRVAANIRDRNRTTLIPYGSEISGQIEPAEGGSRFVAKEIIFPDGTTQSINATSQVVTRTETVKRGAGTGNILKGAAAGAAAATVIAAVTGDRAIATEEVLGGAGIGALGGLILGRRQAELISIDPNQDLDITLQSDLALR